MLFGYDEVLAAGAAVGRLVETPASVSGVDLVERAALAEDDRGAEPWALGVRVSGTEAGVEAQLALVSDAVAPSEGPVKMLEGVAQARFWRAAVAVAEPPQDGATHVVCRFSALSSQAPSLLGTAGEIAQRAGLQALRTAHLASGVGRVRLSGSDAGAPYVEAIGKLRAAAEHLGAVVVVESAPVEVKRAVDVWGLGGSALSLEVMRSLRHAFDPNQTLNPGRFLTDA